jgi:hypothetical protein
LTLSHDYPLLSPDLFSRNFHLAFPAATVYCRWPLLRSFSAFVPEPKNRTRLAEPLSEPKGQDLPHFEAISQTPASTPSVVQIGFAFLPSLPGWQRQSLYLPQYASKQGRPVSAARGDAELSQPTMIKAVIKMHQQTAIPEFESG